jgi:hypothetical protein
MTNTKVRAVRRTLTPCQPAVSLVRIFLLNQTNEEAKHMPLTTGQNQRRRSENFFFCEKVEGFS